MPDATKDMNAEVAVCPLMESKLAILNRYLSITEQMKLAFDGDGENRLAQLASERQDCIQKVDRIDAALGEINVGSRKRNGPVPDGMKPSVDGCLSKICGVIEAISSLDREVMAQAKSTAYNLKSDLLKIRHTRTATGIYTRKPDVPPRFFATRS